MANISFGIENRELLGLWIIEDKPTNITATINFEKNGTFSGHAKEQGKVIWKYSGKWWLEGKTLKYEYLKSDRDWVNPGFLDSDMILGVNAKTLKLKQIGGHRDGDIMIYTKVIMDRD